MTQRYVHDLRMGKARQWPRQAATFSGLATALETTPLAVVLGYAAEFGVPVEMSEFATRLPPGVDALDEAVKESLLGLIWAVSTGGPARRFLVPEDVPDESDVEGEGVIEGRTRRASGEQRGQQ